MSRLLVLDDSPTIRKLVELTFRASAWSVDFAAGGLEGISLARKTVPDVILLDFVLPDMSGLDVCARLAADERTRAIPVLLMSAKDEGIRGLFSAYPSVIGFLAKPFSPESLAAQLRPYEGLTSPSRPPAAAAGRFTHAQKEAAASHLR